MPVMDGIETTRAIRGDPALSGLPVIGLSASALAAERERCIEAGMNDFVAKPIVPPVLYASLERWSGRKPGGDAPAAASAVGAEPPTWPCCRRCARWRDSTSSGAWCTSWAAGTSIAHWSGARPQRGARMDGLEQMYADGAAGRAEAAAPAA